MPDGNTFGNIRAANDIWERDRHRAGALYCQRPGRRRDRITCNNCQHSWRKREEKKTDVAIAAHMVADARMGEFDVAMLISGDSDLVPPVEMVAAMPNRRVVAAFPPSRKSHDLRRAAGASTDISRAALRKSQLADSVALPNGMRRCGRILGADRSAPPPTSGLHTVLAGADGHTAA